MTLFGGLMSVLKIMSPKKKLKKKSKGGKHLRQANTIVLILISRWTIKDNDDEDDDVDDNDNDDNDDDDDDDDEDNDGKEGGYNDDDDDDDDGDFERILEIVFYDFLGILGGF